MTEVYIGLMSGTSMDGIDAALVDFSTPQPMLMASHFRGYEESVYECLQKITHKAFTIDSLARIDKHLGLLYASMVSELLAKAKFSATDVRAIGSHGQTIYHQPDGELPNSLQIGDPHTLAARTGITTVSDFRRRDMALGGQGAPLAPLYHEKLFRTTDENRVLVNIGGIANLTYLPADPDLPVKGFDIGPGNVLLDAWTRRYFDRRYDNEGEIAREGKIYTDLLDRLLSDAYFVARGPKSLDKNYFSPAWLDRQIEGTPGRFNSENILSTLVAFTAHTIAQAVRSMPVDRVILCGGGVRNKTLIEHIARILPKISCQSSAELGVDPDGLEAMAFAWFAQQTLAGRPLDFRTITGAETPAILGSICH